MDEDLSRNLDPRQVLTILNEMGISNINAQQLKEFMMDLKKLIRLDMEKKKYSNSTISSRLKSAKYTSELGQVNSAKHCCGNMKVSQKPRNELDDQIERKPTKFRKMRSSDNFINTVNVEIKRKSDPVSLYSYYANQWEKYKPCLPGETSRADLRWAIRKKLLTKTNSTPRELTPLSNEELARRRDGWIE